MKTARIAAIAALCALPLSCGEPPQNSAAPGSTTDNYSMLQIASAQWSDGPEPRVVVSGDWSLGISTPPTCDLLEGASEVSDWYDPYGGMSIDGGSFRREFVAAQDRSPAPQQGVEYRVRCEISQDTGTTIEATAPVQGSPPAS